MKWKEVKAPSELLPLPVSFETVNGTLKSITIYADKAPVRVSVERYDVLTVCIPEVVTQWRVSGDIKSLLHVDKRFDREEDAWTYVAELKDAFLSSAQSYRREDIAEELGLKVEKVDVTPTNGVISLEGEEIPF